MPLEVDPQKQRKFAIEVVRVLREAGYEAYWAGGCVRDELLGLTPKDYDVATNARPDEVRRLFPHRRMMEVGAAFGVLTILGRRGEGRIEVATFRKDDTYSDGRHPDRVFFSTAEEDAKRRDFTINGLFYDPLEKRVLDYVGGQEDLRRRLIRAIGDPEERFREDKLRMLRAIRFAATYDFTIEPKTFEAIRKMAPQILQVSPERIAMELERCLLHPNRRRAMELLVDSNLASVILPELAEGIAKTPEVWKENLAVLERLKEPTFALALAALYRGLVTPHQSEKIARRLRFSNQIRHQTAWLLENFPLLAEAKSRRWSQVQPVVSSPEAAQLVKWGEALVASGKLDPENLAWWTTKRSLPPELLDPPPLISGDDLQALGLPPGPLYRQLLQEVRNRQLDGELRSKVEALEWIRTYLATQPAPPSKPPSTADETSPKES